MLETTIQLVECCACNEISHMKLTAQISLWNGKFLRYVAICSKCKEFLAVYVPNKGNVYFSDYGNYN